MDKAALVLERGSLAEQEHHGQLLQALAALRGRFDKPSAEHKAADGGTSSGGGEGGSGRIDFTPLKPFEALNINNVGDPLEPSHGPYGANTHDFELGVVAWFAELWDCDPGEPWGFVANGGTEANIQGVLLGREALPGRPLLYHSTATHYSLNKAAMLLQVERVEVGTLGSGEIDYEELRSKLEANSDRPAILALNIGTNGRGAVDDPAQVAAALAAAGFTPDRFHIHCDGALAGIMLPFMEGAPRISFRNLPIGSVSVSGHKFLGVPTPCGVILARRSLVAAAVRAVARHGIKDVVVTCSRSGHTPLYLWYTLSLRGTEGVRRQVQHTLHLAQRLKELLEDNGFPASLNAWSTTVIFDTPADEAFVEAWHLPCKGGKSWLVAMPAMSEEDIESFVDALAANRRELERQSRVQQGASEERARLEAVRTTFRLRQEGLLALPPRLEAAVELIGLSSRALEGPEQ